MEVTLPEAKKVQQNKWSLMLIYNEHNFLEAGTHSFTFMQIKKVI